MIVEEYSRCHEHGGFDNQFLWDFQDLIDFLCLFIQFEYAGNETSVCNLLSGACPGM
jgi:hypothetical protein